MGIRVNIYRSAGMDCTAGGISSRVEQLTITNAEGPFEPTSEAPAAKIVLNQGSRTAHIVPEAVEGQWTIAGGNYATTSDSRFSKAVETIMGNRFYGALSIHDRVEG